MFEIKDVSQFLGWSSACYDQTTGMIYNCKEGEFVWYHEDRHRQQWLDKRMYSLNNQVGIYMLYSLLLLSFGYNGLAQFIASIAFLIYLIPEIDAHIYAIKMKWLR